MFSLQLSALLTINELCFFVSLSVDAIETILFINSGFTMIYMPNLIRKILQRIFDGRFKQENKHYNNLMM